MYYDLIDDFALIESSFQEVYNINLRDVEMEEQEFFRKLATLRKGALVDIVRIRAEKDKNVIKRFSSSERAIYNAWQNRKFENKKEYTKEELIEQQKGAQAAFRLWAEAQRKQNK